MSMSRIRRSVIGVVGVGVVAVIAPVVLATPAVATPLPITIASANGVLTVTGTTGPDTIMVRGTPAELLITAFPDGSVLSVPSNCSAQPGDTNDATCPGPFTKIVLNGGKGNDILHALNTTGVASTLNGGNGSDQLFGTPVADTLSGGQGNDLLQGNHGNDFLSGGLGAGFEPDADRLDGGTGIDTGDYFAHNPGAVVTRDGLANDGSPGEMDNVASNVEKFVGRVTVVS